MKNVLEFDEYFVEYEITEEIRNKVFEKVMDYFITYESFWGEVIMQSDVAQTGASEILAEIADDIIKFNLVNKE